MAGLGKLVKQAEKMKRGIEALQAQLDAKEIDVTAGGGAVKIKINGSGKYLSLTLDPEFLKEDSKLVADTILAAVQDAAKQAKEYNESEMQKITGQFQMPGDRKSTRLNSSHSQISYAVFCLKKKKKNKTKYTQKAN